MAVAARCNGGSGGGGGPGLTGPAAPASVANYAIVSSTGAVTVPGTTLVPGSQGANVTAPITFPFAVAFYEQTYTSGVVGTNGNLQFTGNSSSSVNFCLPNGVFDAAILVYQGALRTDNAGEGIFTS